ncbi:hypothetical protein Ccur_05440 [Cryptobacterium curtum DSM 15641]|uniref:Uncharacterized protein n=1 Tax=Cryptobacterium curtum (strain ATCC 700683 / DSM 15641 / CCUG 43107 / 12-3) TaxID=469378 RepID=C7MMX3_CRYCD|nr:hypothetical protein Ccur_05440 [Cryptobacterium curtum DSM 15641]
MYSEGFKAKALKRHCCAIIASRKVLRKIQSKDPERDQDAIRCDQKQRQNVKQVRAISF